MQKARDGGSFWLAANIADTATCSTRTCRSPSARPIAAVCRPDPAGGAVWLFKVVELVPQGRALQQLHDRRYADKYRDHGEPIHLIGIKFSKTDRNIVGFEVRTLLAAAAG